MGMGNDHADFADWGRAGARRRTAEQQVQYVGNVELRGPADQVQAIVKMVQDAQMRATRISADGSRISAPAVPPGLTELVMKLSTAAFRAGMEAVTTVPPLTFDPSRPNVLPPTPPRPAQQEHQQLLLDLLGALRMDQA